MISRLSHGKLCLTLTHQNNVASYTRFKSVWYNLRYNIYTIIYNLLAQLSLHANECKFLIKNMWKASASDKKKKHVSSKCLFNHFIKGISVKSGNGNI